MTSEFCTKIYLNSPEISNSHLLMSLELIKHFWFVKSMDNVIKHGYIYHITSEEECKLTDANMSLADKTAKFQQSEFDHGYMDLHVLNILAGEIAPPPMTKDVYDKIMGISHDFVKIINFVLDQILVRGRYTKGWRTSANGEIP